MLGLLFWDQLSGSCKQQVLVGMFSLIVFGSGCDTQFSACEG